MLGATVLLVKKKKNLSLGWYLPKRSISKAVCAGSLKGPSRVRVHSFTIFCWSDSKSDAVTMNGPWKKHIFLSWYHLPFFLAMLLRLANKWQVDFCVVILAEVSAAPDSRERKGGHFVCLHSFCTWMGILSPLTGSWLCWRRHLGRGKLSFFFPS